MQKRLIAVYGACLFLFMVLLCSIWNVSVNASYAATVERQTTRELSFYHGRGDFYDRNGALLTGLQRRVYTVAQPGGEGYQELFDLVSEEDRETLYLESFKLNPFLVEILKSTENLLCFEKPVRYGDYPIAVHTIGYINGAGDGVDGAEKAFDGILKRGGDSSSILCRVCANGKIQIGSEPTEYLEQGTHEGIRLTLDADIQRICEDVAAALLPRGAIVVLESSTAKVLANVSMPQYDPENVQESIRKQDTALLDRTVSAYNVGSVFKPFLAALALEEGIDPAETYECRGYIEVNGHIYECAHQTAHGVVDMQGALEKSCNCYFIQLGKKLDLDRLCDMAALLGFGEATPLGGGLAAAAGYFPTRETLNNTGELATFSFGQGQLLATPIQIAAYFNTFANDGVYLSPTLAQGIQDTDTGALTEDWYHPSKIRLLSGTNNEKLKQMLIGVVEEGLAKKAKPAFETAAGKTGTAQTGRFGKDENGDRTELYNSWFAGFYPAENPRYTIVILKDDVTRASDDCTEIFAQLCNRLYFYDELWKEENA